MGHFLDNGDYEPNTVDSIRRACSEPDWDGYGAKPIPEAVLKNAEFIATSNILPEGFEMFPCPDGSVQFEYPDEGEEFNIFEIYETEFIHSYRGGYTGFYAWEDFLRYIGTLDLKFCYPKHVHTKRIEGAI